MTAPLTGEFDEALELLKGTGPEFQDGKYSNHGPMAAEALARLGRAEAIVPWVERYRRGLDVHPRASRRIDPDYREALGDLSRFGDWVEFFDRELAADDWRTVLDRWVERLAPGVAAAATHGVIRTAHAVRSLEDREDAARLHEVAEGLGYWATRYQPIVADARAPLATRSRALGTLPLAIIHPERNIMTTIALVARSPQFKSSAGVANTQIGAEAFLDDLTTGFAHAYLTNVRAGSSAFVAFIHGVTGPRAVRLLLPHVSPTVGQALLQWTWLAAAAIYEGFAEHPLTTVSPAVSDIGVDDLVDRAVATGDEHAMKFTEACLDQYRRTGQAIFLEAASDAVTRMS